MGGVAVILLGGGSGSRMGIQTPKQFLSLNGKTVARYSFDLFLSMEQISKVVVVVDPAYRHLFDKGQKNKSVSFALPGKERQESLENGFHALATTPTLVCIHDMARPFVEKEGIEKAIEAAKEHGAALIGVPAKSTIKKVSSDGFVIETPDRSHLWEAQTPQIIRYDLLQAALKKANEDSWKVTDDVSLIEKLGHPVKMVQGSYTNIKITTPDDWSIAEQIGKNRYKA